MCVNFPLCPDYLQGEIGLASQTSEHILTHSWPIRCFGCEGNLQFILGGPSVATVCLTHSRGNSPLPLLPVFSPSNQLQPLSQSNYSNFTCFSVYIVPMIYFSRDVLASLFWILMLFNLGKSQDKQSYFLIMWIASQVNYASPSTCFNKVILTHLFEISLAMIRTLDFLVPVHQILLQQKASNSLPCQNGHESWVSNWHFGHTPIPSMQSLWYQIKYAYQNEWGAVTIKCAS